VDESDDVVILHFCVRVNEPPTSKKAILEGIGGFWGTGCFGGVPWFWAFWDYGPGLWVWFV
jgi:hypothetical protein